MTTWQLPEAPSGYPRRPLNHPRPGPRRLRRVDRRSFLERPAHEQALCIAVGLGSFCGLSFAGGLAWAYLGWEPFCGLVLMNLVVWVPFVLLMRKWR